MGSTVGTRPSPGEGPNLSVGDNRDQPSGDQQEMPTGGHLHDEVFRVPMLLPPAMVLVRRPCDASDGLPMSVVGSVVADASQVVLDRHFEDAPTGAVGLVSGAPSRTPSMSRPTNPRTAPIGTWDGPGPFGFPANAIQRLSTVAFRCSSGRSPWRAAALTPTMTQERPTVGGADVARPVGALAEHQDQVALATELGDDDPGRRSSVRCVGHEPQASPPAGPDPG